MKTLATLVRDDGAAFSLASLPSIESVRWGELGKKDNIVAKPDYLFFKATNKPVTIFIVGVLNAKWLTTPSGKPNRGFSVNVAPILPGSLDICNDYLAELSLNGKSLRLRPSFNNSPYVSPNV